MSRVVTQFVLVCALTLTGMLCAGCDKGDEVQEKAMTMPAERFPDGRYHLDLLDKRAFDIAQVVEAHPDLVRIDAKNAEGTSSRWWKLEEGDSLDDIERVWKLQNDGQDITVTVTTAAGETFEYKL